MVLLNSKFAARPLNVPLPQWQGYEGTPTRITPRAITEVIKHLNNKKPPSPDQISHSILKLFHQYHPTLLSVFFTSCIALQYFPKTRQTSKVVFILKLGKPPMLVDSYRLITFLWCIGKVFEWLINQDLLHHFKEYSVLHSAQFGFHPGHSTEEAIQKALYDLKRCRREYRFFLALSCDIKGAFDNVHWDKILALPALQEILAYVWNVLSSYLLDWSVTCEGPHRPLYCGYPQAPYWGQLCGI